MFEKLKQMEHQLLHGNKLKEDARNKEKDLIKARMELNDRKE